MALARWHAPRRRGVQGALRNIRGVLETGGTAAVADPRELEQKSVGVDGDVSSVSGKINYGNRSAINKFSSLRTNIELKPRQNTC